MYRSMRSFVRDARHNKLLAVPAGLYAINNYLKFAMQLYFKPTTAKMLGNLKVGRLLRFCNKVTLQSIPTDGLSAAPTPMMRTPHYSVQHTTCSCVLSSQDPILSSGAAC